MDLIFLNEGCLRDLLVADVAYGLGQLIDVIAELDGQGVDASLHDSNLPIFHVCVCVCKDSNTIRESFRIPRSFRDGVLKHPR